MDAFRRPVAAGLLLAGAVGLAACGGSSIPTPSNGAGTPRGGTPLTGAAAHVSSVARASTTAAAALDVESGATSVDVVVGAPGSPLVTAATPAASGQLPTLVADTDHGIGLQLRSTGAGGPSAVTVTLSPSVVWTVDLDGGATVERIDLRGGKLAAINLGAGASRVEIYLPIGHGTQTVNETGGVSALTVTTPPGLAVKVRAGGGAGAVHLDGVTHSGVGGGSVFSTPADPTASARAYLDLSGGVSDVVVRQQNNG